MIYRLIILTGSRQNERVTIEQTPMTIGRDPDCAIRVDDPEVAGKHAAVEHAPEGLLIRDLGSMNRVLVNKREVRETRLKHNDLIELGRTRFLVQAVVQAEVSEISASFRERSTAFAKVAGVILVFLLVVGGGFLLMRPGRPLVPTAAGAVAPSARAAAAGPDAAQVTEELTHMRQALADIRESVRVLAARQAAASAIAPSGSASTSAAARTVAATVARPPSVDDALRAKTENMLKEARRQAAATNLLAADQILASLQILAPDALAAYEERARLFEQRGMPDKAIGQWLEVLRRSSGTASYEKAAAERARLEQTVRRQAAAAVRKVKIASVEQYKFRESEDFDEMRILNIALVANAAGQVLNPDAVLVQVTFFDEDPTGAVVVTRALSPKEPLKPEGFWHKGEEKLVTATYVLPKGFRDSEARAGRPRHYCGYVVRVLYQGELEDTDARPKTLLSGSSGVGAS
jgi:predicted component of type VI protein secretion system